MKNEVWEKVERIFHSALGLPVADRHPFLQRECADDDALFSEVQSLLKSFEQNSGFLQEPVFELGLEALGEQSKKDLSGAVIGSYKLEKKIGAGGMGEVYKALDTRLNRRVALKFLSEALENDNAARRRLVKEAQAAAMLEHPNICAVHGIEESNEHHFIVMQYIEGKTLADSLGEQAVTVERFRSLARQMVAAVAFAHSHGVIHRDLKPGNIMLAPDGQIKVLDFGLAKVMPRQQAAFERDAADEISRFSQSGLIIGTVSYMSPEQLRGEKLDYRSDIFSLGIVLYELLTGQNPFKRESQAETIAAILSGEPPALKKNTRDFPESLGRLVDKCLQKDREARFQSAAEMLVELDKTETESSGAAILNRFGKFFIKFALVGAFLAAVLAALFFFTAESPQRTLAVLPIVFDNPPAEKEYLADGLTQSIIDKLSNLSGLKVKNESIVERYKGKMIEPQAIGKELSVDAVCLGSIVRRGGAFVLTTKIVKTSDGQVIDGYEEEIEEANLLDLVENVSARIVSKVKTDLSDDDKTKLARKETNHPEAKLFYIRGRHHFEKQEGEDLKIAEQYFKEAIKIDPVYAKAWTGLADTYSLFNVPGYKESKSPEQAIQLARAAARKAIDIDESLCEPYISMGMIKLRYDWEWDASENYFRAAINCNSEIPQAHLGLSNLLIIKKEFARSVEEAKRAKEVSPFSVLPDLSLARTYYFERNYQEMDRVLKESLENFRGHQRLNYLRGLLYLETGKITEAIEIFEKIYQEDKVYGAAPLGLAYGRAGRKAEALKILVELTEFSKKEAKYYVSSQEKAIVYLGLGETDKVFEYLNKSCEEKFAAFPFVMTDPIFDEIRADPRFPALQKCANL